jgi:hypothetical protein
MGSAGRILIPLLGGLFLFAASAATAQGPLPGRLGLPPAGSLYHGVYPGGQTGEEDDLTPVDVASYQEAVGKRVAWVYFSHNAFRGAEFPWETALWIREGGAVPYIRLMLRSDADPKTREKIFTLQAILNGTFDEPLRAWARRAREFGSPLIVEYGTEFNGRWFPWNAKWNGDRKKKGFGSPESYDGPERFVAAWRHIVGLMRTEGATNLTWVWHANNNDDPETPWNRFELYYPGDDYVDWIAVSAYGAQTPKEKWNAPFREMMDLWHLRSKTLAPDKPVIVAEFGVTAGNALVDPAAWAEEALTDLIEGRWPGVVGFSWWNERWENDNHPGHDTTMRVQDIPALADIFRRKLNDPRVVDRPVIPEPGLRGYPSPSANRNGPRPY